MATFRHTGNVPKFRDKFIDGMVRRGYDREFAEHCFRQIEGFGEYGFPESHAASFALLVYASAWIKCRYPDVFCAAILNSQPMGFYQPAQLVRDARQHGVEIRAPDVNYSNWDCTLEASANPTHAVRLGFRLIHGLAEKELNHLVAMRGNGFSSIERFAAIAGVSRFTIERLAEADAFRSLGLDRRAALWAARRLDVIGISATKRTVAAKTDDILPLLAPHLGDDIFPGTRCDAAGHGAERACRRGLHRHRAFPERASGTLLPRPSHRTRRYLQYAIARRRPGAGPDGHRLGPRSGAPATRHIKRRRVHDARRRDRHRQYHRLAESFRR